MKVSLLWSLVLSICTVVGAADESEKVISDLIAWLVDNDGVFNDKLEIRRADPSDPTSRLAMFAKDDIIKNNILLLIPRPLLLTGGKELGDYGDNGIWCPTAYKLIEELKLGDESFWAPYVKYLLTQEQGQLPSHWSDEGKELLMSVIGDDPDPVNGNMLRPEEATGWVEDWQEDCNGGDDRFEQHAALMLLQRGWDDIMIPVFDMMSHRNGKKWLNTKSNSVHNEDSPVRVRASKDIKAGDEIYTTYNFCKDCGNRANSGYGTPELLRDFGFVEMYPQRWYFGKEVFFELDEDKNGKLRLTWINKPPSWDVKRWMQTQLERLKDMGAVHLDYRHPSISNYELNTISQYHQALITAMTQALIESESVYFKPEQQAGCEKDGASCAINDQYDDLGPRLDLLDYSVDTCGRAYYLNFENFRTVETIESHYQLIEFHKDTLNGNVCFHISKILQMCDSYRPHYHEMVVHYTARFLKEIKRVLWVGGGDSMLLHEILKYPSLELVVGLEIDQFVTRYSFKHMGTQPHFDNDKVQWWYGDATKSLLMLPVDYFGSFDMILVDLSETVMSMSVTEHLDIFQALSLLLKPEGIFVKNEHKYMDEFSKIFQHSLQIHYNGVPEICSQCLIFGSNKIDFLNQELTDHNLGLPYLPPLSEIKDTREHYQDYRHNTTSMNICQEHKEVSKHFLKQTRSPGILMIVEAEEATADLHATKKVLQTFVKALKAAGFSTVSSHVAETSEGGIIGMFMKEGYVSARLFPSASYCAIDVHLWSNFDAHGAAKKGLVAALGSKRDSDYRIVAGGIFGISNWKKEKKHGPQFTNECEKATDVQKGILKPPVANTIVSETMKLIHEDGMVVAVMCGANEKECQFADLLKKEVAMTVVPVYACSDIDNEFKEDSVTRMIACEKGVYEQLMDSVKSGKKIRAVLVDPSTTYAFCRIGYKVLNMNKKELFQEDLLVMSPMFGEAEDWRRNMLERFRKDVIRVEPVYRTEVLFKSTKGRMEMGITYAGDVKYIEKLRALLSTIEEMTGLKSDVRDITGGLYRRQDPNWELTHFFLPEDYDQRSPLSQYSSQQPVALQNFFQIKTKKPKKTLGLTEHDLKNAVKETLARVEASITAKESDQMKAAEIQSLSSVGDGLVVSATWVGGNCVVLWDGRNHINLNLFTYDENENLALEISVVFISQFSTPLVVALRDEQPRGYGGVVNFREDILPRSIPDWAKPKEGSTTATSPERWMKVTHDS